MSWRTYNTGIVNTDAGIAKVTVCINVGGEGATRENLATGESCGNVKMGRLS